MPWKVVIDDAFSEELRALADAVRAQILAHAGLLREFGPGLGRPSVDTLNGSKHANVKELRFQAAHGAWRLAFAFDPRRRAVLLVAADRSGGSQRQFYKRLIAIADKRFDAYLVRLKTEEGRK